VKRFILLSLLLHALLLAGWSGLWTQQQPVISLRTLSLQLQTPRPPMTADNQPVVPDQQHTARVRHETQQRKPATPAGTTIASTDSIEKQNTVTPASEPAQSDRQARDTGTALSNVRAAVYSALQATFVYPRRARLRGWQGTVVIALRVLPDGAVTDVQVSNSSGIGVLDDAAMRSISALHIPEAVAWMNGRALAMQIPVEYRLTDG
jgi:periplasmic protein TonB